MKKTYQTDVLKSKDGEFKFVYTKYGRRNWKYEKQEVFAIKMECSKIWQKTKMNLEAIL